MNQRLQLTLAGFLSALIAAVSPAMAWNIPYAHGTWRNDLADSPAGKLSRHRNSELRFSAIIPGNRRDGVTSWKTVTEAQRNEMLFMLAAR